jgi:hypothetical protein
MSVTGRTSEKLFELKKRRGGFKSSITRALSDISHFMKKEPLSSIGLNIKFESVDRLFRAIEDNHKLILQIITDETEVQEAKKYVDDIFTDIDSVKEWAANALQAAETDRQLEPKHSVSQVGSVEVKSSTKAAANAAAIAVAAGRLQEMQELEMQELALKQKKKMLELRTQLDVANAEREVYDAVERGSSVSNVSGRSAIHRVSPGKPIGLDPTAPSWTGRADIEHAGTEGYAMVGKAAGQDGETLLGLVRSGQQQQQEMIDAIRLPKVEIIRLVEIL